MLTRLWLFSRRYSSEKLEVANPFQLAIQTFSPSSISYADHDQELLCFIIFEQQCTFEIPSPYLSIPNIFTEHEQPAHTTLHRTWVGSVFYVQELSCCFFTFIEKQVLPTLLQHAQQSKHTWSILIVFNLLVLRNICRKTSTIDSPYSSWDVRMEMPV